MSITLRTLSVIVLLAWPLGTFALPNSGDDKRSDKLRRAASLAKDVSSEPGDFVPGVLVVKFREAQVLSKGSVVTGLAAVDALNARHQIQSIAPALPFLDRVVNDHARELRKTFIFRFAPQAQIKTIAADYNRLDQVEYAEPRYRDRRFDAPNDPMAREQGHLAIVNAMAAWDVVKGDTGDVVIAIVDGGADWRHEDLQPNLWINQDEIPENGIDDDNNGFVDDVRGWNFATDANDPSGRPSQAQGEAHGTHVAGIAGAATHNDIGIAGLAWNSQIMILNIASRQAGNDSTYESGYEAITYAAANGASIINCSWGNRFRSSFAQEVIDFAYANGALVIASAGNENVNSDVMPRFPANYNHVLAVGGTTPSDEKISFSNFGASVGVFAPGTSVLSTFPGNRYGRFSGTSFSAPIVSGLAALVKTRHPDWDVDQIREQIRMTADPIEDQNGESLRGLLGQGRINAARAVGPVESAAIRILNVAYREEIDDADVVPGETINLDIEVINYLMQIETVAFQLTSDDARVTLLNAGSNLGSLDQQETATITFQFQINQAIPKGTQLNFGLDMNGANYSDRDLFRITINPPLVIPLDTGTLRTAVTSQGNIGFLNFSDNSEGEGFIFNGVNMLFEGGLLIGTGFTSVSDCIRGSVGGTQDDEFRTLSAPIVASPGQFADHETTIIMDDSLAANPLNVRITQSSYAFARAPFSNFVILRYRIENRGSSRLENLHAGLFVDWDLNEDAGDFARFHALRQMGYVQNSLENPTLVGAVKRLTRNGSLSYRSVHNPNEIYGGNGGNGFIGLEKWNFMSGGVQTTDIDATDSSILIAEGPFTLESGASVDVAFAVLGASTPDLLFASADAAQKLWDNDLDSTLTSEPPVLTTSVLQNPAATRYANIVAISDRSLRAPPQLDIWVNSDTTRLNLSAIPNALHAYSAPFEFSESGGYTIRTRAQELFHGQETEQSRTIQVISARVAETTALFSDDGLAKLTIAAGALQAPTYFVSDQMVDESDGTYLFGPDRAFASELTLTFSFDPSAFRGSEKPAIHRAVGEQWHALPDQVFLSDGRIEAQVRRLGKFKIAALTEAAASGERPETFDLSQNYPNPFNPTTVITYDLPQIATVNLVIYNALGQPIRRWYREQQSAGTHKFNWDARDSRGRQVAAGIYFYRLAAGPFTQIRKMVLLQ